IEAVSASGGELCRVSWDDCDNNILLDTLTSSNILFNDLSLSNILLDTSKLLYNSELLDASVLVLEFLEYLFFTFLNMDTFCASIASCASS
ncbi:7409_t:CDS:2, partial [Dentiscutata erythropus]